MKNREKFKNEIVDIICNGDNIAVNKKTRVPLACTNIKCNKCLFYNIKQYCIDALVEWANQEYKCNTVISQGDIEFLNYIADRFKCIARDKNGDLFLYTSTPTKYQDRGIWLGGKGAGIYDFRINFPMIKWSNEQPWKISDLKKLKVVENY